MPKKIIILTEGNTNPQNAKTAASVIRYRTDEVVAVLDSTQAGKTSGELLDTGDVPIVAQLDDAPTADTLLIGIAPSGGKLPAPWRAIILEAVERGMDVVSGLHDFLTNDPQIVAAAAKRNVEIFDVRKNNERDVATQQGIDPNCLRILTVGNDCSLGKMVVSIEVARGLQAAGEDARFVATGQTGIMISGDGCPVDCVVSDFVNGAAERLVLANQNHKILLIEGQGSLFHPSYSAVSLGLLHGTMPDGMILCYEAGRKQIKGLEHVAISPLEQVRSLYESVASVMHPSRVIGIGINSRNLTDGQAAEERSRVRGELGLPACDVLRDGAEDLVQAVIEMKQELGK